jgi:hypothetical protein
MQLLICDLDGVIANNEARFAKAEEAKQQWIAAHRVPGTGAILKEYGAPGANDIYWQTVFNPELVVLDTLIEGVPEALDKLYGEYGVIFLTSRPESMRGATEAWLEEHDISVEHPQFGDSLVMKQPAFQFVKTITWKSGMVQMLHKLFDADELCFIDDEPNNRQAVLDAYPDGGDFGIVKVYASLAEAVAAL